MLVVINKYNFYVSYKYNIYICLLSLGVCLRDYIYQWSLQYFCFLFQFKIKRIPLKTYMINFKKL